MVVIRFWEAESWCWIFESARVILHCENYVHELLFCVTQMCELTWRKSWTGKHFALKAVSVLSSSKEMHLDI